MPGQFLDFVLDQLGGLPDVRAQRMFGGVGLYAGETFFGIVFREAAYFKVDDENRDDYLREGMTPFKPFSDKPMTMQYYAVPPAVLEDPDELCRWARRAIDAAARAPRKPAKRKSGGRKRG